MRKKHNWNGSEKNTFSFSGWIGAVEPHVYSCLFNFISKRFTWTVPQLAFHISLALNLISGLYGTLDSGETSW